MEFRTLCPVRCGDTVYLKDREIHVDSPIANDVKTSFNQEYDLRTSMDCMSNQMKAHVMNCNCSNCVDNFADMPPVCDDYPMADEPAPTTPPMHSTPECDMLPEYFTQCDEPELAPIPPEIPDIPPVETPFYDVSEIKSLEDALVACGYEISDEY